MKTSKFTEPHIAFTLKQADGGVTVAEVCRRAGISDATVYTWRKKYAGLMPSGMRRLRQLEEENAKLRRMVADLSLNKAMQQDVPSKALKPAAPRDLVEKLIRVWEVSVRRASSVLRVDRPLIQYKPAASTRLI